MHRAGAFFPVLRGDGVLHAPVPFLLMARGPPPRAGTVGGERKAGRPTTSLAVCLAWPRNRVHKSPRWRLATPVAAARQAVARRPHDPVTQVVRVPFIEMLRSQGYPHTRCGQGKLDNGAGDRSLWGPDEWQGEQDLVRPPLQALPDGAAVTVMVHKGFRFCPGAAAHLVQ